MQLAARGAQRTRDESKKLSMYSKQWLPGDQLRVFYPIFWDDNGEPQIAVGAVWGHSVSDIKGLGLKTAFIPSTTEFDENAQPIGIPDVTYQFSQIAKVFVNGQKAIEEKQVMNKNWPSESLRKEALKTIEDKYDSKNNMKAVKPIVGRAQYYISTEVVSVKIANGAPVEESIALSSAPLSNTVIDALYMIMSDEKYAPQPGDTFLEVEWKYPVNAEKSQSAKDAKPAGLTAEYRFATQYADMYAKLESIFGQVAKDSETITRRATKSVDPNRVRQALTQYAFLNSEYLDVAVEEDEETLLKHVDLVKELDLTRAISNEGLVQKITTAIAEMQAAHPIVAPEIPNPMQATASLLGNTAEAVEQAQSEIPDMSTVPGAPTVDSLINGSTQETVAPSAESLASNIAGQQNVQSLLNNVNNVGAESTAAMEEFDMTSMV